MVNIIPVDDPSKPICRYFVKSRCKRGRKCRFYHPKKITPIITRKATKKLGYCYCGAKQITLVNKSLWKEDDEKIFFVVCGRTRKSIKRCMVLC